MDVREKLVELLRNSPHLDTIKGYKGNDCTLEQGADWLIAHGVTVQERIVDAVEVVRCRECKYHEEEGIEMVYCPNMIGGWVENEWFCANGERKEGAD